MDEFDYDFSRPNPFKTSLDDLILYAGDFSKDGDDFFRDLVLLDPKTGDYKVLSRENGKIWSVFPFHNRVLSSGAFSKDGVPGAALTLLDPWSGNYRVLAREKGPILSSVRVGDEVLYSVGSFVASGDDYTLVLLNPWTGRSRVLAEELHPTYSAVPFDDGFLCGGDHVRSLMPGHPLALLHPKNKYVSMFESLVDYVRDVFHMYRPPRRGKYDILSIERAPIFSIFPLGYDVLYAGAFPKGDKRGSALTLLNLKTNTYRVLAREFGAIYSAVFFGDKVLYGGDFSILGEHGSYPLVLLDPKTGDSEVLARENGPILSIFPVSRPLFEKYLN